MSMEIHVPISPNQHFFTMLHHFAASLRLAGGALADSPIVVTVGEDCEPEDLSARAPWSRDYPIRWSWVPRALFRTDSYYATALERFRTPFSSDVVMMADVDTFFTRPFDDVVARVAAERAFTGLIAHVSPFPEPQLWRRVFEAAGLGEPPMQAEHTGWGLLDRDPARRLCPPYFNLGMLIAPAEVMRAIGAIVYEEMAHVNRVVQTHYRCQIAVGMAVCRLAAPWFPMPMRYNFPNDHLLAAGRLEELLDVRLFHYLRVGAIDKKRDFATTESVGALLARRDLRGVDRLMCDRLGPVHERVLADLRAKAA